MWVVRATSSPCSRLLNPRLPGPPTQPRQPPLTLWGLVPSHLQQLLPQNASKGVSLMLTRLPLTSLDQAHSWLRLRLQTSVMQLKLVRSNLEATQQLAKVLHQRPYLQMLAASMALMMCSRQSRQPTKGQDGSQQQPVQASALAARSRTPQASSSSSRGPSGSWMSTPRARSR